MDCRRLPVMPQGREGNPMIPPRKSLVDILNGGMDRASLARAFDETEAADDMRPLPPGVYRCRLTSGELTNAKSGTPGYAMTFTVDDGEHKGRKLWHTAWLTAAALPVTKRDLAKLGVTSLDQLDQPLPVVFVCDVRVALRADDDGTERNRVVKFDVVGVIENPTVDPDFGPDFGFPLPPAGPTGEVTT
jgi:hypothetical protein